MATLVLINSKDCLPHYDPEDHFSEENSAKYCILLRPQSNDLVRIWVSQEEMLITVGELPLGAQLGLRELEAGGQ